MCAIKNSKGFTLIEFMVSVLILTVGLLGLLQAINLAISTNMNNTLRNEATTLADETLSARVARLSTTDSTFTAFDNNSSVRRKTFIGYKNYSVVSKGTLVDPSSDKSLEVNVSVSWKHKDSRYTHNASTVLSKRQ